MKTENIVLALLIALISFACVKDEIVSLVDTSINQETELRTGEVLPDFFKGSMTIWDSENKKQISINVDSLSSVDFVRANTSKATKTGLIDGLRYTAGVWRVVFHWRDSTTDLSGVYYVQDTAKVNIYSINKFTNTTIGNVKYREYIRTDSTQTYYHHYFNRNKKKYLYLVDGEPTWLECWHHPISNVFFLNHRN